MDGLDLSETYFILGVLFGELVGYGSEPGFARVRRRGVSGLAFPSKQREIIGNSANLLDWSLVYFWFCRSWNFRMVLLDDDPAGAWMVMPARLMAMVMRRRTEK